MLREPSASGAAGANMKHEVTEGVALNELDDSGHLPGAIDATGADSTVFEVPVGDEAPAPPHAHTIALGPVNELARMQAKSEEQLRREQRAQSVVEFAERVKAGLCHVYVPPEHKSRRST